MQLILDQSRKDALTMSNLAVNTTLYVAAVIVVFLNTIISANEEDESSTLEKLILLVIFVTCSPFILLAAALGTMFGGFRGMGGCVSARYYALSRKEQVWFHNEGLPLLQLHFDGSIREAILRRGSFIHPPDFLSSHLRCLWYVSNKTHNGQRLYRIVYEIVKSQHFLTSLPRYTRLPDTVADIIWNYLKHSDHPVFLATS
jgi:hypothetical protein